MTTTSASRRPARCPASQATPSTSRWLVGSSSTSRSESGDQQRRPARPGGARRRTAGPTGASRPIRGSPSPPSTSRTAGVAGPLVHLGRSRPAPASRTVAAGRARCAGRRTRPAVRRCVATRPASGCSWPVSSRSSVVLPPPLRPTTPIRSPAATPSETPSSTTVVRVRLGHALQVDERGPSDASSSATTPGAGHRAVRDPDRAADAGPGQRGRQPHRRLPGSGQERAGRPGAGDDRAERAEADARPAACGAAPAAATSAGACRSLASSRPSAAGSCTRSALISRSGAPAAGGPAPARSRSSSPYTSGVDRPAPATASTQCQRPAASTGVSRSPRPVPSAVPPVSANGDVAAQLGGQLEQLVPVQPGAPQRVAGDQRRGRVGAAAGQPAGHRDALGQVAAATAGCTPARSASSTAALQARLSRSSGQLVGALAADRRRRGRAPAWR